MKRNRKFSDYSSSGLTRLAGYALTPMAGVAAVLAGLMVFAMAAPAHAFPWSIDMFRSVAIQPLEIAPRVMPDGVLPVDGLHQNLHYGQPQDLPGADEQAYPPMGLEAMTVRMHNPLQPTPVNLKNGHRLFLYNCAPCHGATGKGDGTVVHLLAHKPANLMTGVSKNLPDGYVYGYIRNGGIWMPSYDDAMSSTERWQVVLYMRNLEKKYGETEAAAASPASSSSANEAESNPASEAHGSSPNGIGDSNGHSEQP